MEDEIKLAELIEEVGLDRADFLSFLQDPGPKKLDQIVTKETKLDSELSSKNRRISCRPIRRN